MPAHPPSRARQAGPGQATAGPATPGPGTAGPAGAVDRAGYLWEVLRILWPEPASITRGRAGPATAGAAEYVVLPTETRAALLLPRRPRRAAAGALRSAKASAAAPRRLLLRGLAVAARAGLADAAPDRISIVAGPAGPGGSLAAYLAGVLGQEAVISLRIGAPRANRKPVLQLLSRDGRVLGFAKVGVNALTRDLVRAESAALGRLATAPLTRVGVPRLIHHGQWRGHEILVQQALTGAGPARNWAELSSAMTELAGVQGRSWALAGQSPYWHGLHERLRGCAGRSAARELLQALDGLQAAADRTSVEFGSWHGDWTPWNMAMSAGRAMVWDWERFQAGIPVGYDAVHYRLQQAVAGGRVAAPNAAEAALAGAPAVLAPFGVQPGAARLVAALYLAEIGTRYVQDGQAEAGARLGDVSTWLLPVLARYASGRSAGPYHAGAGT